MKSLKIYLFLSLKKVVNGQWSAVSGWLFVLTGFFVLSCKNSNETGNQKLQIVCTTGMIGDAVKNITEDRAEIITLMGPGVDPHLYKATQGDLSRLQDADIIVFNGLHLEGKMSEVLEKLSSSKKVIAIGNGIHENKLRTLGSNVHDPHIWFDVALWKDGVNYLTTQLINADTSGRVLYSKNAVVYAAQLDSLDAWVRSAILTIPEPQRVLITAHDAFGYFGKAYQIEVRGLQGISTVSDYGLNDVTQLVDELVKRKIKAIFVETSVSDKAVQAVVDGCRSKGHEIKIGGSLYSDAMGAANTPEGTYIGMVRKNVTTIVNALK